MLQKLQTQEAPRYRVRKNKPTIVVVTDSLFGLQLELTSTRSSSEKLVFFLDTVLVEELCSSFFSLQKCSSGTDKLAVPSSKQVAGCVSKEMKQNFWE